MSIQIKLENATVLVYKELQRLGIYSITTDQARGIAALVICAKEESDGTDVESRRS